MPAEKLLPFLETGWHYRSSGPEKMRTANSNFFLAGPDLCIYISGSCYTNWIFRKQKLTGILIYCTVPVGMGSVRVGTVEPQFETEPIQGGLNILNRGLIKPV